MKAYERFLSVLIAEQQIPQFVAIVNKWITSKTFDQSFTIMASRENHPLTVNLLQLLSQLPKDILGTLAADQDDKNSKLFLMLRVFII